MNKTTLSIIVILLITGCNGTPTIQKTVVPTHPFQNLALKGKAPTSAKNKTVQIHMSSPSQKRH